MTKHPTSCSCPDCQPGAYLSIPYGFFRWSVAVLIALPLVVAAVFSLPALFLASLLFLFPYALQYTPRLSSYDMTWRERLIVPSWGAAVFSAVLILAISYPQVILFPLLLTPTMLVFTALSFFSIQMGKNSTKYRAESRIRDTLTQRWFAEDDARAANALPVGVAVEEWAHCKEQINNWIALQGVKNSRKILFIDLFFTYDDVKDGRFSTFTEEELAVYQALRGIVTAGSSVS